MTKKEYMRKLFIFQPYEIAAVENFLTDMASKGWMLESIKGRSTMPYIFVFQQGEPQALTFSIDYFRWGSIYEDEPMIPTQEYIEYCEEEGWQHICTKGKMQVFYTELEDAVPIQTDEEVKLKSISDAFFKQNMLSIVLLFPLLWLYYYLAISSFENLITENLLIVNAAAFVLMATTNILLFMDFFKWRSKAKKRLNAGKELPLGTKKHLFTQLHIIAFHFTYVLAIVYIILPETTIHKGIPFLGIVLSGSLLLIYAIYFEKRNYSTAKRRILVAGRTLLFLFLYMIIAINMGNYFSYSNRWTSDDTLRSFTADLPKNEDNTIILQGSLSRNQKSVFVKKSTHRQYYRVPEDFNSKMIQIYIFESPYEWINKKIVEERLNSNKYAFSSTQVYSSSGEANTLYVMKGALRNWKDMLILEREDKVLILQSELELAIIEDNIEGIEKMLESYELN